MKKFLFVALAIFTLLIITACSATTENSNKTANKQAASSESAASESPKILRGPNVTLVAEKGTQKLSNGRCSISPG